jgi:hypothetical protein
MLRRRAEDTRTLLQLQRAPVISVSHFRGALQNFARNDNHLRGERPQITMSINAASNAAGAALVAALPVPRAAGAHEGRPYNQGMAADASRSEPRAQRQEVRSERSELGHERRLVMSPRPSLLARRRSDEMGSSCDIAECRRHPNGLARCGRCAKIRHSLLWRLREQINCRLVEQSGVADCKTGCRLQESREYRCPQRKCNQGGLLWNRGRRFPRKR